MTSQGQSPARQRCSGKQAALPRNISAENFARRALSSPNTPAGRTAALPHRPPIWAPPQQTQALALRRSQRSDTLQSCSAFIFSSFLSCATRKRVTFQSNQRAEVSECHTAHRMVWPVPLSSSKTDTFLTRRRTPSPCSPSFHQRGCNKAPTRRPARLHTR